MHFSYFAKKMSGQEMRGVMESKDRFDLAKILKEQGYILVSCREQKEKKFDLRSGFSFFGRISISEKIFFSRNLSVMISAGVAVSRALEILGRQTKNKRFKKIINALVENIKQGGSLSDGLKKYPRVFSILFSAMVRVGEETGKLSESLTLIGEQLDRDHTLRKKVRGAMMYPAVVITVMIIIGILMMIYVVPTLTSTFQEIGVELPMSTRIIIAISNFFVSHTLFFLVIVGIVIMTLLAALRSQKGKNILGKIFFHLPLFSTLIKKINSARTSRTLSSLVSSGVDILESLEITKEVVSNPKFKDVLDQAKKDIQKGVPISESFKKASAVYPILMGEMIAVGEETGKLTDMLLRLATFYEDEVAETTKNMSTIIEPILMVIIGAVVGFFAISMIKPMYSMVSGL